MVAHKTNLTIQNVTLIILKSIAAHAFFIIKCVKVTHQPAKMEFSAMTKKNR